jgi:hypothetical protein
MDTSSRTSEKMRPILQAMERSVESARRRRLQVTEPFEPVDTRNGASGGALGHPENLRTRSQSSTVPPSPGTSQLHSTEGRNGISGNAIGGGIGRGHPSQQGQQPVILPPLHPHSQHNGGGPTRLKAKPKRQFQSP